jgi:hypothetical protein
MSIAQAQAQTHPLFREIPSWVLVKDILHQLGLSQEPPFTFTKQDIRLDYSDELASLLAPYYKPCKASQFLEHTDELRWITVIRHIIAPHGYCLSVKETSRNKKKTIFYTMERQAGMLKTAVKVDFS